MRGTLAENTQQPRYSIYIVSLRHRTTLELVRGHIVEVLLQTHEYFVFRAPCTRDIAAQVALITTQILNTHTQDHAIFVFTPFEIAPTHLYIGYPRLIRCRKKR